MFFGSYAHSLDDKNRLVIPSKMRSEIGTRLYIMKGFDGAVSMYPEKAFEKLMSEFNSMPFNKKDARSYLRTQLASTSELEIDKAGRVIIPGNLLTKYSISKSVMVIGMGDHIEIWDSKVYEVYEAEADKNFEDIAENLIKE
ncbi:MAG: division/cell wall cluster transcriptional repressor MraZ [Bacilli bacterium]|nr:division/cell wall cluster transcriptional repressor MraZ [Bacilli bacterium]